ncbi:MAG: NUDIX domain-containing protein [Anaerolineae bacterium]
MSQNGQGVYDLKGRHLVVPRTLCFVTHGDDVLLLRGAPDKHIWPGQYNGVGGHVEPGEDVRTAARREVREETGLEIARLQLRGIAHVHVRPEIPGVMLFIFTAVTSQRQVRHSAEGTSTWVPRHLIEELDLVEDLPTILPRVLAMAPSAPPFFAHYRYDQEGRLIIRFSQA